MTLYLLLQSAQGAQIRRSKGELYVVIPYLAFATHSVTSLGTYNSQIRMQTIYLSIGLHARVDRLERSFSEKH
jgi:hypothetical protein